MTEANYSFTTKLNGDLLTVRGTSFDEFAMNVATLVANGQAVATDLTLLQGFGAAAGLVNTQPSQPPVQQVQAEPQRQYGEPPAQQNPWQNQQTQQAPPQQFPTQQAAPPQQGAGHLCQCGQPMKLRNSQYGSFYSCAKQMSDQTRCQAKINV